MSGHSNPGKGNRRKAVLMMALAIIASSRLPLEAQNTSVTGVVKSAAGEPVSGALVKVSSQEERIEFMVVTQAQGRYSTPNLLPGKYTIQAFGGTHQSPSADPIELRRGRQGKTDVVLSALLQISPREKRMTDAAEYEKLMPVSEDGIQHVIAGICSECHSLEWILSARKTPEKWQETLDRMGVKVIGNRRALSPLVRPQREHEDPLMMKYFSKHFTPGVPQDPRVVKQWLLRKGGPSHPNRNLPPTLLTGAAAKYFAMEFSLPAGSAPHDIAVDSQGIAWVSERNPGMLGRFDPNSLAYGRMASPPGAYPEFQLNAVAVDPQDQIWCVDDGPNARILQYDPKSREFNSYPIPEYRWPVPEIGWARIQTLGFLKGQVWAAGKTSDRIIRLDPKTRRFTHYPLPRISVPFGLAISSGMVWYSAQVGNAVMKLDPSTSRLTPFIVPTLRSGLRGMAADGEGNLWVAALESGKLVNVDRTGNITEYSPPTEDPGPFAVAVDAKRNLIWFSEVFSDRIARFDPGTSTFVEFPHPSADSDVRRIEVDRSHPNRVWWSSPRNDKIGYMEVMD